MQPLLCVLCASAVNQRSLGGGAALACSPLSRPQAGSYVVSTRRLVGARLRATCWILTQRRRGAMADAASSLRSLHLCGELKVARGRCGACGRSAGSPASGLLRRQHPLARRSPLAGDALEFTAEGAEGPRWMQPLLCVLCVSAVNQRSLGEMRRLRAVRWVARKRAPTSSAPVGS
jgi:hypothetical protein